jgi:hypothetical protein
MLDKLNVPLKVRQERLGHADSRLTWIHTLTLIAWIAVKQRWNWAEFFTQIHPS